MSINLEQIRKEDIRREVLHHLAGRPGTAQDSTAIHRRVSRGQDDWTLSEVVTALGFLEANELVATEREPLGATTYYQATGKGILHNERNP